MELYNFYLASLVLLNVALAYHRHRNDKDSKGEEILALPAGDSGKEAKRYQWEYFGLYALVMAADWLQVSSTYPPVT